MSEKGRPIGFFALWHNKRSEYDASADEGDRIQAAIGRAFRNGQARGIRMDGRYGCRWSAERQYFTFWTCPDLPALEATMDDLEKAGDFRFADSEHIIGMQLPDPEMTDGDPPASELPAPIGFFALWRMTEAYWHATPDAWQMLDRRVRGVFEFAHGQGVHMAGRYDCRWSSAWDFFTFWQVPTVETLDAIMDRLEAAGDFWLADSRHIVGNLEPAFRFARHLRPESD
jgi:hypothetical protein